MIATRREWNELYVVFSLLAKGEIALGDSEGKSSGTVLPISEIIRNEHNGSRRYIIDNENVRLSGEGIDESFPREDFSIVAGIIFDSLRNSSDNEVEVPEAVEGFLDALQIFDMEAVTDDRTDFHILFADSTLPPMGFRCYSRLCGMLPLLDGGRTANLKYEQSGVRFSQPAVNKINYTEHPENPNEVARRILYIESLGGVLKYNDVADKIFRSNLSMIDLHFPRVLAEMLKVLHLDNITRVDELVEIIEDKNPLKIKEELIRKHGFYRYKMKEFLLALALGMRPAKIYNGRESAVSGFVMVNSQGNIVCYRKTERETFADFLYSNTRLEKGLPEKDKYGYLERENKLYYLKLNLKISFVRM